jgi:hypothetical protein
MSDNQCWAVNALNHLSEHNDIETINTLRRFWPHATREHRDSLAVNNIGNGTIMLD